LEGTLNIGIPCSSIEIISIVKFPILNKVKYRFNEILMKVAMKSSTELEKNNLEIHIEKSWRHHNT
jgi:hypothetical protein